MTQQPPVARFVLLGASNLRLVAATLIANARASWGGPIDVFLASGFGRSYGCRSSIPLRSLPGILECGLWTAIESQPKLPTFALITDVGNDLIYGRTPIHMIDWVESCLIKLNRESAQTVITQLPIHSVRALSVRRYKIFSKIFFPQCNLYFSKVTKLCRRDERTTNFVSKHTRLRAC